MSNTKMLQRVIAVAATFLYTALVADGVSHAIVPPTPCHQKCLDAYEEDAVKCGKLKHD
jgi:hypothetical protein